MRKQRLYDFYYHIAPTHGLLNDPNGLVQFRGQYHVFYQWNQEDTTHANKSWGHLVSDDMVNWHTLPVALEPTDWYDKDGVYSGSAIVFEDELYLFYTGNVKDENNNRSSYQCLATSKDGVHFKKHGPLFTYPDGYTAHVRDPKVWWDDKQHVWWMVLGAQREDLTGDTIVYQSTDLKEWVYRGSLMQFAQPLGYMWECPDLIAFDTTDVFIFSPQGLEPVGYQYHNIFQTCYVAGKFENGTFDLATQQFREVDRGFEFYAPQTFVADDKRIILYAWMGTMPTEMETSMPTVKDGWIHHLSVPRVLTWQHDQLYQYPVIELNKLRQNEQRYVLSGEQTIELSAFANDILFDNVQSGSFNMCLRHDVCISYDKDTKLFCIERTNWNTQEREQRCCLLDNVTELRLLVEESSLELFINGGQEVFSLRYFTQREHTALQTNIQAHCTVYTMTRR